LAAEDILLEGIHADIAIWPSSRGELAISAPADVGRGDTAVEYRLGETAPADVGRGDTAVEYRLGETAPDVSFGDTAVEYLLAEAAEDLSFGSGSEARRGVMCVMVSFCSNGLATAEAEGDRYVSMSCSGNRIQLLYRNGNAVCCCIPSWFTLSASEDPSARAVETLFADPSWESACKRRFSTSETGRYTTFDSAEQ
jgi:hypothetical protein